MIWLSLRNNWSMFKIEALIWVSFWRAFKFQLFGWRVGLNPRHRFKNIETNFFLKNIILNLCMIYMVHVFSTMWRIKNQPSNSTSCSDNALRFVSSCGGLSMFRTSSDVFIFNMGLRFKGLFWERYILKGQIAFEGHWRLQSWKLQPVEVQDFRINRSSFDRNL